MSAHEARLERLVVCGSFHAHHWQLPVANGNGEPAVPSHRLLVGWKVAPEPVDGGMPSAVGELLASALCRHARATFAAGLRRPLGAGLLPRRWRVGRDFEWITTSDPRDLERAFDDALFAWSEQGQVVVLWAHNAATAPLLSERFLELPSSSALFQELSNLGATGVMLPAVDGQVAGVYCFSAARAEVVRVDLTAATLAASAPCVDVAEDQFGESLR